MAFDQPEVMHRLLTVLADSVADYLRCQIEAGAQAVQVFDTWGGVLPAAAYREFSLDYMSRIVAALPRESEGRRVPVILFTKNGGVWLDDMADAGADCLGLDWTVDIGTARAKVGDRVALQGNMDPALLRASPDRIRREVAAILDSYAAAGDASTGHVFNLGHGIPPDINPDHVAAFVNAVVELSAARRG